MFGSCHRVCPHFASCVGMWMCTCVHVQPSHANSAHLPLIAAQCSGNITVLKPDQFSARSLCILLLVDFQWSSRALCHTPMSLWSDVLRNREVLLTYLLHLSLLTILSELLCSCKLLTCK